MPKWIACIIAYNEEQLLPQCLDSIKDKVDKIVLVEGQIAAFPGVAVRSADRTIEIAESYGAEVITQGETWADEATMRNQYLAGKNGDWYLHIDADERLMTLLPNIADFPAGVNAYGVNVKIIGSNHSGSYRPRLFRHKGEMEYRKIHDALFSDGVLISQPDRVARLKSVWFAHYQMKRDASRRAQKQKYYTSGYAHESDYRQEWGMFNSTEGI